MNDLVLAIDIGTSSVRAMIFDATGSVLSRAQIAYPTLRPAPYFEEQDPDLIRTEVFKAMRGCLAEDEALTSRVGAICFSSQLYGVIALDENNRPLTNNIIWSDGRAETQADDIKARHGELWLYPQTGCPMNSIFPLAKIAWLRENRPSVFADTRRFVSIKEYVTHDLLGEWLVDYSMASATGMFDIRSHQWSVKALEHLGVTVDQLSTPVSGLQAFSLQENVPLASCRGLNKDVKVFLGGGDGPLANIGSGAASIGDVNIDLGTSGAARCITDKATVDDTASLWCFCLTDQLWAVGGIVTNVGNAYQWLGSNILGPTGLDDQAAYELLNTLVTGAPEGLPNLYFMPYLRKARSPYWDGRLKGTIYGLTADHTTGHVAKALLEAVAFDLRKIVEIMKSARDISPHIVLTGGLAKSPIIPQLLADVLQQEIRAPEDSEGSIAGAAVLGLAGIGVLPSLAFKGGPRRYRSFVPDDAKSEHYNQTFVNYTRLVDVFRGVVFEQLGA